MAWEISISGEGWQEIRDAIDEHWDSEELLEAITDDTFERVYAKGGLDNATAAKEAHKQRLSHLCRDTLADIAFDLIQTNNTCDNGGWAYWIDREGYHKVVLD